MAVEGDPRFVISRAPSRLGFYRNFERCLTLVPEAASYVALSDQDDRWHSDKIATLVEELESSDAVLVFSDMNVVDADGRLIATTYWLDRRNNFSEMATLLLANTVTGAASLFRRQLLGDVLPFPPDVGEPYHDHWIACVALAQGRIAYVDRPLHDYVQHQENVLGHPAPSADLRGGLLRAMGRLAAHPRRRLTNTARHAAGIYRRDVVRVELFARTLELRLGDRIVRSRAKDVHRAARIGTSPIVSRVAARPERARRPRQERDTRSREPAAQGHRLAALAGPSSPWAGRHGVGEYASTTSAAGPSARISPRSSRSARSQNPSDGPQVVADEHDRLARPHASGRRCAKHFSWNSWSPTASTSSSRRMSNGTWIAIEYASRSCIPEE